MTDNSFWSGFRNERDKLHIAEIKFWIAKMEFGNLEFGTIISDSKPDFDKEIIHGTDNLPAQFFGKTNLLI